jgi:SWI/SNF-related matrix-associated actin-dependent regulator of chromatin subfamily A member 5
MEPASSPPHTPSPSQAPSGRKTASALLAQFLPGVKTVHKMDRELSQRVRPSTSYPESNLSPSKSPFDTPPSQTIINLEDGEDPLVQNEEEGIQYAAASRRRSLRDLKSKNAIRLTENGFTTATPPRSHKKKTAIEELIGGDLTPVVSERVAIRQEIASQTASRRNRFFVEKKDFWLPLLPPNNYVRKLVEKHERMSEAELAILPATAPYEEIGIQPKGVKAIMKPYQLSGLSFLVYLQKNGLSGILGKYLHFYPSRIRDPSTDMCVP